MCVSTAGRSSGRRTAIGWGSKVRRHRGQAPLAGDLDRPPDDGLVADVDAVEGADGHHAPRPAEGQVAERAGSASRAGPPAPPPARSTPAPSGRATATSRPSARPARPARLAPPRVAAPGRPWATSSAAVGVQLAPGQVRQRRAAGSSPPSRADLVRGHGVVHRQLAHRRAPQRGEVGAAAQALADVRRPGGGRRCRRCSAPPAPPRRRRGPRTSAQVADRDLALGQPPTASPRRARA